ncbi:restriction endonuclease subunit S [Listeria monocytogenes]|uniref:restriction endonuclease subunit S n=1 Tax=Listeria monocytogenes TaxID=1639 RepID=UPI0011EB97E0|nr:restriction endonuclease subunit S [Listeria monocytogenes]ECL0250367.1 restriction endonuclease subunit S [Listeria monocytogenes]EIM1737097.1 restriction endonuclease subunit S [Listeria monocytogenes]EIM1739905.1 restriction endonuclease subunit S [Listeria monocytogenes]TYV09685.1 restriction endonuclease subunit S [Listeria monocytogenes]TYV11825.1 restriction endonuclease subunit S [Listeria monocytogenes]
MSQSRKSVPKRRFMEFNNAVAWEQRKLGKEVENVATGRSTFFTSIEQSSETPYAVLGSTSVISYDKNFDHSGDFILTARVGANAGNLYKYSGDVKISDNTVYIQAKSLDFVYYLLNKFDLKRLSFGTGQPLVKASELKNLKLMFPNDEEEQQKIGKFFKYLDDTIALHQRKLEKIKALKTAYLSEMFPAEGETKPKRRFAGFTDDWEQRKFIEIINRLSKTSNSSILPKVEYEDIIAEEGRLNKDISNKFDSRKGILFQPNNILYGKLRPYLKNWLYPDFKGVAVGDFWVFEAIEATPRFIYNLIQSDSYQKAANDTAGTKMPRSDWTKVSNSSFFIPEESSEQKIIGTFFKQLDNTIALHQRKLQKLQNIKKAYLNEMFI